VEYVVKDGEVIIVDTFTGRLMPGRRWSDGLHQSIERRKASTSARKTRRWRRSPSRTTSPVQEAERMTGTAETEAAEFEKIYKLEIVVIPTTS